MPDAIARCVVFLASVGLLYSDCPAHASAANNGSVAMLAYLGFYREGCVCPIGAIQNVVFSLVDRGHTISIAFAQATRALPNLLTMQVDGEEAAMPERKLAAG